MLHVTVLSLAPTTVAEKLALAPGSRSQAGGEIVTYTPGGFVVGGVATGGFGVGAVATGGFGVGGVATEVELPRLAVLSGLTLHPARRTIPQARRTTLRRSLAVMV